mgnify:FL=1
MTKDEKIQALIDEVSKCWQKIADFYEISTSKVIWMGTNRFKVIKNNEEIIVFYLKNGTIITKEERDRKRYETFKLKWMIEHGYSLIDFVSKINACYEELQAKEPVFKGCLYDKPSPDIWDALDLFEDTGFEGGMIYPCFNEWLDNEYTEDDD